MIELKRERELRTSTRSGASAQIRTMTYGGEYSRPGIKKRRKKKKSIAQRIILACSILTIILTVSVAGLIVIKNFNPFGGDSLLNIDFRTPDQHKKKVAYFLFVGVDQSELLTDVLMVACFDIEKGKLNIMNIPRDTYVNGHKINELYARPLKGETRMEALIRVINDQFAIPIDHYVLVTIDGFKKIVDLIGGVEVNVKQRIPIPVRGIKPINPGKQTLNGAQAEWFIRYRGYATADLGRIEARSQFLADLAFKLMHYSSFELTTNILPKVSKEVETNMNIGQMTQYGKELRSLQLADMKIFTMPGEPVTINGISYYSAHKGELLNMLNTYFAPYIEPIKYDNMGIEQKSYQYKQDPKVKDFDSLAGGEKDKK